jgi:hypothetical protein
MTLALCLTGELRNFKYTKNVIAHGLRDITNKLPFVIGILPRSEDWTPVLDVFQDAKLVEQDTCNVTLSKMYACSKLFRPHCRENFIQTLCDAQKCWNEIHKQELETGKEFKIISRMRPDTLWETHIHLPSTIHPNEIHVPQMNVGWFGGVNDQFAIGGRQSMHKYLNRILNINITTSATNLFSSERFLYMVMKNNNFKIIRHNWVYCLLSFRQVALSINKKDSCISRWATASFPCINFVCESECICNSSSTKAIHIPYNDQLFIRKDIYNWSNILHRPQSYYRIRSKNKL